MSKSTRITTKLLDKTDKLHDLHLYQGKYRLRNEKKWHFVLFEVYSEDADKAWKNKGLIVADAITGDRTVIGYEVIDTGDVLVSSIKPKVGEWRTELDDFVDKEFKKAQKKSDKIKGLGVGKMIQMPVADGSAFYVVSKITKTKVKVEWRGYCPDRWTDRILGWGGSFDKKIISSLCCY